MNGLDLFSGIGGITKALEGYVTPVAYCENDRYAQACLLSRMWTGHIPRAPIWDDVRTLSKSDLPILPDVIYGGFPCQDISVAGRGAGLGGERSGLFSEIIRLVSEIRPRFVFLENVPAIIYRGLGTVAGEFARLRYDTRWGVLSAFDVGAPHLRERWFLMAHAMPSGERGNERKSENEAVNVANAKCHGIQGREANGAQGKEKSRAKQLPRLLFPSIEDAVSAARIWRADHGVSARLDSRRNMGIGNSVCPPQAREAFERLMGIKFN